MADTRDKLYAMLEEGILDANTLARDLLGWLSEDECKDFAHANDIQIDEDEDEDEEEEEEQCL